MTKNLRTKKQEYACRETASMEGRSGPRVNRAKIRDLTKLATLFVAWSSRRKKSTNFTVLCKMQDPAWAKAESIFSA